MSLRRLLTAMLVAALALIGVARSPDSRAAEPPVAANSEAQGKGRTTEAPAESSAPAAVVDEQAKKVLAEAAKTLMVIQSIEFRAERDGEAPPPPKVNGKLAWPTRLKYSYIFRSKGSNYRIDEFDTDGAAVRSRSFNGKMYQYLDLELSMFRESKQRLGSALQTPFPDPISLSYWPYSARSLDAARSWQDLHNRENWDDIAKHARFVSEVTSGERTTVTIEVEGRLPRGQRFVSSSEFDKGHDYVPIAWSIHFLPDPTLRLSVVVKRWADVDAGPAGRLRIPTEVEEYDTSYGGLHGLCRIVESTLRINQSIDDDEFTLPRERAKHIVVTPFRLLPLDEKPAELFKKGPPLAERLAAARSDARQNYYSRILLVLGDAASEASKRLIERSEKEWAAPLKDYLQVAIAKDDGAAVATFKETFPDLADLRWPAFVVLDDRGKVLGSRSLALLRPRHICGGRGRPRLSRAPGR